MPELGSLLAGMVLCWALGACLVFVLGRRAALSAALSLACAGAGSACGLAAGLAHYLSGGESFTWAAGVGVASDLSGLGFEVYIDRLAALFVVLICLTGLVVSVYSFAFLEDERERVAALFNFYLLAMVGVVVSSNVLFFLIFWELVTLASVYMVLGQHNKLVREGGGGALKSLRGKEALTAPRVYLIASHVSTMLVTVALLWLAVNATSFSFADLRAGVAPVMSASSYGWVFLLTLVGCGIKAGVVPFHVWLPYAHPTSPANIHAVMSGVMIKVAIYALVRVIFDFLWPGRRLWWGETVLLLGAATAFVGVLYAIFHTNLKTALAYHSIENIGIILAGIGLAMIFGASVGPEPAAGAQRTTMLARLALVAGFYHLINHTVFKSLLFLCTGAIEKLTGTVEMEKLGGLAKSARWTSAAFGVGALAISGFPPFNGFVSEWLTLQTLFAGLLRAPDTLAPPGQIIVQVASLILLTTAFALTAFCFVKICGTVLLGHPRGDTRGDGAGARDVAWSMRGPLVFLAAGCLLLGVFPYEVIAFISRIAAQYFPAEGGGPLLRDAQGIELYLPVAGAAGAAQGYIANLQILPLLLVGVLLGLGAYGLTIISSRGGRGEPVGQVWSGGSDFRPEQMQFTEAAFTFWILQTFGGLLQRRRADSLGPDEAEAIRDQARALFGVRTGARNRAAGSAVKHFRDRITVTAGVTVKDISRAALNRALFLLVRYSEGFGGAVQNGDVRSYLLYIFLVILFVFLLLILRVWG